MDDPEFKGVGGEEFKVLYYTLTFACFFLQGYWVWNLIQEFGQLKRDGLMYFKDVWNYLDTAISLVSQVYMI